MTKENSARRESRRQTVDMTQGSILRHIITFALPLLVGNVFQQLYNMVDTWVVGNYVSNEAFSAVGTVGPIINTLIGLFLGLSSGAGAVISQHYGAKQFERVQDAVHTAVTMTLVIGVAFTALGIGMTPLMLRFMKMPPEVTPEATTYLTIYFAGVMGLMLYNIGAGILRSVGDSRRPFYFLVVCAVPNTVLDLFFVLKLHMGVEGVALATILAQFVSAALVIATLMRTDSCVKLRISRLKIHWPMMRKIFKVGIPAALQMAVTAFSNVFVQSYINYFGNDCMSGWTAYAKVDQFMFLPMQSVSIAATTFVGQNLGSNQTERARRGVRTALAIAVVCTLVLMVPVVAFAPQLVWFFNRRAEVIAFGTMLLRYISPFYVINCVNQVYAGALRGAGNSRASMVAMLSSFVVFRQCYLYIMSHYICNEIIPIAMGYPAGWLVCSVIMVIYFRKVKLTRTRLVDEPDSALEGEADADAAVDAGEAGED